MLFRLIAIRTHKNIVFFDSFNNKYEKIQLAMPIELFKENNSNFSFYKQTYDIGKKE